MSDSEEMLIAQNKKARHDYAVLETFEAGMVLRGTEIKAIRNRRVNLKDGYVRIKDNEAFLVNVHISPYEQGNLFNHDALRTRKLLLHKKQISKLVVESKNTGVTIIPLKIYIKNGFAKVLIGVAKGKRQYDKRHDLKKKDMNREINRALKSKQR